MTEIDTETNAALPAETDDVQGHLKVRLLEDSDDVQGHKAFAVADDSDDDVEGHKAC